MSVEHSEKNFGIFKIASNMAAACIISGIIIAGTYYLTAPIAAEKSIFLRESAMKEIVKDAESFKPVEGREGWYVAVSGGEDLAYVVPVESRGYGGKIRMLVSVTPEGKVIDYNILAHNETPGLGDNAAKESFRKFFKGKEIDELKVVKNPSAPGIQAMTGATITSKAVTAGVRDAVEQVQQFKWGG